MDWVGALVIPFINKKKTSFHVKYRLTQVFLMMGQQ